MTRSSQEFRTGGREKVADNVVGLGIAGTMVGLWHAIDFSPPPWVMLGIGIPGVLVLILGVYLTLRARRMRVVLTEDGLRCTDVWGRSETIAWSEVQGLELWSRTIPFSGGALDLTWRDIRGREHTRRIASFDPPRGQTMTEDVRELTEVLADRLGMCRESVGMVRGGTELVARWERRPGGGVR